MEDNNNKGFCKEQIFWGMKEALKNKWFWTLALIFICFGVTGFFLGSVRGQVMCSNYVYDTFLDENSPYVSPLYVQKLKQDKEVFSISDEKLKEIGLS